MQNSEAHQEHEKELETKLILSSEIGKWNITINPIAEKNSNGVPWEFGYAACVSRVLGEVRRRHCTFCSENFAGGLEAYSGIGTWTGFTFSGTSQYI